MATEQIAVRLPDHLLRELDALVSSGIYQSRAAAVRAGAEVITAIQRRRQIDQAIVDGYRRIPPTAAEMDDAMASLRDAIAEEPW
jgi:Arc/MetJ-type ribon-helix-helix transcriptional regulator